MLSDPLLERIVPTLADVPGIEAFVFGGSRARGTAHDASDYDIGLYFSAAQPLDTDRLLHVAKGMVDNPDATSVTAVGGWGPWIVGGGWLTVAGQKVDLLYRCVDDVTRVIDACRAGHISMDYQPGHPHGFCSATWMGEIALCQPLHDPHGTVTKLKALTSTYPKPLAEALIHRFQYEIGFSLENAWLAMSRGEQTHIAGSSYRALACLGQVLFALNEGYLINEKSALQEPAGFPLTIPDLGRSLAEVRQHIGNGRPASALAILHTFNLTLQTLMDAGPDDAVQ